MKLRKFFVAFMVLALAPLIASALTSQRAQLGITIIINMTPNPLGYSGERATEPAPIGVQARLHGATRALERVFEAQQLHFTSASGGISVAQVQKSVRVEAEVTPNPTATLLVTNAPGTTVVLNAEAGVRTTFTCVYTVTVNTTIASWQLRHGLSADFAGTATSWPGGDVGNNTHIATPNPTATPFLVYATDGGVWAAIGASFAGTQQFCVDLTVNAPISTPKGTYSSNAIYTLYY